MITRSITSRTALALSLGGILILSACASGPADDTATATATPSIEPSAAASAIDIPDAWSGVIDATAIPLGDDRTSTSPAVDYLYSCKTDFSGRGPVNGGPWIDYDAGTWDATTKDTVEGAVSWPQAYYEEQVGHDTRTILTANVPTEQMTGTFPIADTDPAKEFDRNPNEIDEKLVELTLSVAPTVAAEPSCVAMGAVGVLKNGVYLYNAVDASGGDAVAHETQDLCDGHPDGGDYYHYHDVPSCLLDATAETGSTLVGYALDGFGIYVERDSAGNLPTNADLDECHGRTSTVLFDGVEQEMYHYSATIEFPFTVGCYVGDPAPVPSHEH
ncbi:YHYH protein [Salinibacterium sp. NSLL150]|uniref:YHYH protein n=1 Tax=unclassified Salinibacterium TaxID=2632331 RepID=UPI0018CFA558|nr:MULTISPECIES: YHYH protein [unclassified Salinibacterium]MBH0099204.1 YHYH protein [Salinibacterium sp. NSLL35]MBH0101958.1 YHYH protein [Salinibacterium sp. NSLL150]MBH0104718.1 YHYH protein [Salinibacterium sp. NSLL16]MBH0107478.1 YHYH protein [Salinibacterium sp. NSLL17]